MRRIREDFLKQEVIKHLNHWFSNFRETSDSLGLRLAKNFHFERVQHVIIMQRFSEYSLKNIYLSHIVVPFPYLAFRIFLPITVVYNILTCWSYVSNKNKTESQSINQIKAVEDLVFICLTVPSKLPPKLLPKNSMIQSIAI